MESTWMELENKGFEIAYGEEEKESSTLFVFSEDPTPFLAYEAIESVVEYQLPPIDWESQWQLHGHHYQDGHVLVDFEFLGLENSPLKLLPGAGFGDLSHPTTRLTLRMMKEYLKNQIVIDIGSGSGILSVTAAALGATRVYGFDIDPEAIEHSSRNAAVNSLSDRCIFLMPDAESQIPEHSGERLILMNMIMSEQVVAWESFPKIREMGGICITSGIREEERQSYLDQAKRWGWSYIDEITEEGWIAFSFKI